MKLIITDNDTKYSILQNEQSIHDYKFMTSNDFFKDLTFKYDYKTIIYLMKKYNYNIDICIDILNSLYLIDNKEYKSKKLNDLKNIKQELLANNLLYKNDNFNYYLKEFDSIEIKNIFLEKYEQNILDNLDIKVNIINDEYNNKKHILYKFNTFEEEVSYVCQKIIELINKGVDINKIVLTNISNDNNFVIEKIFNIFNIPIELDKKKSIYNTPMIKEYFKDFDISKVKDIDILNKLTTVMNTIEDINDGSNEYKAILKYLLKNTYIDNTIYKNSIKIKDINSSFFDDEYVFLLSFNNDVLPKYFKDDQYLSDNERLELDLYLSYEKNKIIEKRIINKLNSINNLYLSYHLYNGKEMYISNLVNKLDISIEEVKQNYNYSNKFNRIKLTEMLDDYYNYNVKDSYLDSLYNSYLNRYNTYDNSFDEIDINDYLDYLKKPFTISFSSLDNYNLCRFKYYINNILRLEKYEEKFSIFIGNLFHYLLSLCEEQTFNFDREWSEFVKNYNITPKEEVLLSFIKNDFREAITYINELDSTNLFKTSNNEVLIEEHLEKKIDVIFKGIIDKIIIYENMNDTYFAVIDYKTYEKKLDLDNLIYGIDMQLPIYTYLISKSNLFTNPIFAGMFYRQVLSSNRRKKSIDNFKLIGFSTDNINILEKLDTNYHHSNLIKSLTFTDKGFGARSKILSDLEVYNLNELVKKKINEKIDDILKGDFTIDPKRINKENISCKYCNYKDLCFVKEKDIIELDKNNYKTFLGGDMNA